MSANHILSYGQLSETKLHRDRYGTLINYRHIDRNPLGDRATFTPDCCCTTVYYACSTLCFMQPCAGRESLWTHVLHGKLTSTRQVNVPNVSQGTVLTKVVVPSVFRFVTFRRNVCTSVGAGVNKRRSRSSLGQVDNGSCFCCLKGVEYTDHFAQCSLSTGETNTSKF